jgi:hypothetical protein
MQKNKDTQWVLPLQEDNDDKVGCIAEKDLPKEEKSPFYEAAYAAAKKNNFTFEKIVDLIEEQENEGVREPRWGVSGDQGAFCFFITHTQNGKHLWAAGAGTTSEVVLSIFKGSINKQ